MKKQIGLLLLLGAMAAGLLTFLISIWRQPTVPTIKILVARVDLPAGHTLSLKNLAWARIHRPKPKQTKNYIRYTDGSIDYLGSDLRRRVKRAQPILRSNLIIFQGGYYAKLLPVGYRAYPLALPSNFVSMQLIQANDRVNFLLTYNKNKIAVTQTVLKAIPVLAIAPPYSEAAVEKDKKSPIASKRKGRIRHSMILMMTPKQVKTLILAQRIGSVSYTLISARTGQHYGSYPLKNEILTSIAIDRYRLHQVTVFRGLKKETHSFNPVEKQ